MLKLTQNSAQELIVSLVRTAQCGVMPLTQRVNITFHGVPSLLGYITWLATSASRVKGDSSPIYKTVKFEIRILRID